MHKKVLLLGFLFVFNCCCLVGMEQDLLGGWVPIVHKISAIDLPDKSQLIGPCEPCSNELEIYASIAIDLTVKLYAKKPNMEDPGYCISFNPFKIVNQKLEEASTERWPLYSEAEKICKEKDAHTIADEANFGLDRLPRFIWILNELAQKAHLAKDASVSIQDNPKSPVFLCKKRGHDAIIEISPDFLQKKCDSEQICTLVNVLMYLKQVYLKKTKDEEIMEYIADIATVLVVGNPCYAVYLHDNDRSDIRKKLMLITYECYKSALSRFDQY